jgi:hypothetical protein
MQMQGERKGQMHKSYGARKKEPGKEGEKERDMSLP